MAETRKNDLPDIFLGETRLVTFTWAGGAGDNSLESVTYSSVPSGVTFADSSVDVLDSTVFITPAQSGRFKLLANGVLTSGETIILAAYVNAIDPNTCSDNSRDYE